MSGWRSGERVLDHVHRDRRVGDCVSPRMGRQVVGVDLARGMLKRASPRATGTRSYWLEMDATHLAFADEVFDVSVLSLALHHMPEPCRSTCCVSSAG